MVSQLEKSPEVQRATEDFIKAVKRVAHKLRVDHNQLECEISLFVSGLWDKLESEITNEFKENPRLVEKSGTKGVVQGERFPKIKCGHCKAGNLFKDGLTRNGKQRYRCDKCKHTSREDSQSLPHDEDKRQQVMRLYGMVKSYRKVAQLCGVDRRTVANWIRQDGVNIVHPEKTRPGK
jgi:transposase-like protein